MSPEDILGAKKLETVAARLARLVDRDVKRVDMLAAICTRLVNHLTLRKGALPDKELQNLRDFVKLPMLPEDMRLALAQDLSLLDAKKGIAKIMGDPDVAKLLLRLASSK